MIGPKTSKLIALLDELAVVLRKLDHANWADWMMESARSLQAGSFSGITHLLGAYGGMGSFNDILPGLVGEQPDNDVKRARELRVEVSALAHEIAREAEFK